MCLNPTLHCVAVGLRKSNFSILQYKHQRWIWLPPYTTWGIHSVGRPPFPHLPLLLFTSFRVKIVSVTRYGRCDWKGKKGRDFQKLKLLVEKTFCPDFSFLLTFHPCPPPTFVFLHIASFAELSFLELEMQNSPCSFYQPLASVMSAVNAKSYNTCLSVPLCTQEMTVDFCEKVIQHT